MYQQTTISPIRSGIMKQVQIVVVLMALIGVSHVYSECAGHPPVFKWPDECCTFGKLINDPIMEGCRSKVAGNPKRVPGDPIKGSCRLECAFNETGIFANGALNEQQIRTTFAANAGAAFTAAINSAIDACLPLTRNRAAEFAATVAAGANKCSPITVFFYICVNGHLVANCPATNFKSGDAECGALQAHFRNCPNGPQ